MAELFNLRTPEMKTGGRVGFAEGTQTLIKKLKNIKTWVWN